jgi:ribosomal protein L9
MELLTTFIPPTIQFARQAIEQEETKPTPRYGASGAADILTAAAMASKPKAPVNGIYGSVSTADVVATIKAALSHNDEAARVVLTENDVRFIEGVEGAHDKSRVKQLGTFKVEIQVPGAEAPITRNVHIRPKKEDE